MKPIVVNVTYSFENQEFRAQEYHCPVCKRQTILRAVSQFTSTEADDDPRGETRGAGYRANSIQILCDSKSCDWSYIL